jgi:alkylation response protein AidB-like acyl-CoA dehydrogenase
VTPAVARSIETVLQPFNLGRLNPLGLNLAAPALFAHGTDAQRERFLPRIVRNEERWCQLFSEPGAGSDLASLATRAVRDGNEWVLTGQKVWTTWAHVSDYGVCLARTDPDVPKRADHDSSICMRRASRCARVTSPVRSTSTRRSRRGSGVRLHRPARSATDGRTRPCR